MECEAIMLCKQEIIDNNNQLGKITNRTYLEYGITYWCVKKEVNRYEEPYIGPYLITQVWKNGNVAIRRGNVQEHIKIIWIKPYNK